MYYSDLLWPALIFFVVAILVISVLLILVVSKTNDQICLLKEAHQNQNYFLERTIQKRDLTIQNLMDRLMSEDPRTYRILSSETKNLISESTEFRTPVAMSDEAEAARMAFMNPGIGDAIYDDETLKFASDMGIIVEDIK